MGKKATRPDSVKLSNALDVYLKTIWLKTVKIVIKCTVCNEEGHDYLNCPKAVLITRSEVGKSWTDVVQGKAGSEPTDSEHNEPLSKSSPLVIAETYTNSEETTPSELDSQPASPFGSEDLFFTRDRCSGS